MVKPGGRVASLEFMRPPNPAARALWRVYGRPGLPAFGRLLSRDWYEVGRFLEPSISGFYRRLPLERQLEPGARRELSRCRREDAARVVIWGKRGR